MVRNSSTDIVRLSPSNWLAFTGMLGTLCITLMGGAWMMSNAITELRVTTKHNTDTINSVIQRVDRVENHVFGNRE